MRSALVTLLLLAAGGLATPQANAQSDATLDPEGVVLPFAAGDHFSWRISGEQFVVVISAFESGADVDFSKARVNSAQTIEHVTSEGVSSYHFSHANDDVRSVAILNGTGLIAVVRNEMLNNVPIQGSPSYVSANAELEPGACQIQAYVAAGMSEPALLHGMGDGIQFRAYSSNLSLDASALGELNWTVDPQQTRTEYLQACNLSPAETKAVRVEGIYPTPNPTPTPPAAPRALPFGGAFHLLLCSALVAVGRKRRRHESGRRDPGVEP